MQERSAMQHPVKECSAGPLNEGALNEGAHCEAAPSEGTCSEAEFNEGALSEGAQHQQSAQERLTKSCTSPRKSAVLTHGQSRMEPRPRWC